MSAVPADRPAAAEARPAPRPRRSGAGGNVALSRNGRRALTVFFVAFLIFLYVPTALLIIFSFNDSTVAAFPLAGLTTKWYHQAFGSSEIRTALLNSLKVATACGLIATTLGVMVSYPLARRKIWFRSGISALLLLPLVVPTVVLGVALLILFQRGFVHVPLGLGAVLIAHVIIAIPFCVLLILPRLASIDKRLEEAAFDLGAGGFTTFRRIVLPLIIPAILSAFLIAFVVSIDEVVVASFLVSDSVTYPIYLYSGLKFPEKTQTLIPVATVMILLSFLLAFLAEGLRRVGERRVGIDTPTGT
jgi:spermidine/putrescine transport system permease protein